MLYLVLSPSCLSQMEIPYLLNNSPDFFGEQPHDAHWATYELDGTTVDGEQGYFGTVRVHDDYWNIDDEDRAYYNFDVRNSMNLSKKDFDGLLHFNRKYRNCALLLHATNVEEIWAWSQGQYIKIIGAFMGNWENNLEYWAMREYNDIMEDDVNANYSTDNHKFPGIRGVVDTFIQKQRADVEWCKRLSHYCHYILSQDEWQKLEKLRLFWFKFVIKKPSSQWIDDYYFTFQRKQEYNVPRLVELRKEYARQK